MSYITSVYNTEIREISILSEDEERVLLTRIKNGDKEAKEKLIESNLRLVAWIARGVIARYSGYSLDEMDLIQEGNIALINAIDRFDFEKGNRLSTFASRLIYQRLAKYVSLSSGIPEHLIKLINNYRHIQNELAIELGRNPNKREIAEAMGIKTTRLDEILLLINEKVSLEAPFDNNEEGSLKDVIKSDDKDIVDEIFEGSKKDKILELLNHLSDKEKQIIMARFGFDGHVYTLEELSERYNLSRERIRKIEAKTLIKLRHPKIAKQLKDYAW